jgi:Domain of unknown function (DUF6321)
MRFTEIISEAGSPAQQAAIAIAMKKAGKKPKDVAEEKKPSMLKWIVHHEGSHGEGGKDIIEAPNAETAWKTANEWDLNIISITPYKGSAKPTLVDEGPAEVMGLADFSMGGGIPGGQSPADIIEFAQYDHNDDGEDDDELRSLYDTKAELEAELDYADEEDREHLESELENVHARILELNPDAILESENWSKYNHKRVGGMSKKSVSSYRRSHPGSKIQTAVTTKPSKLKKGSKAAKRRASFCARMRGMKKHRTSAKTAHDPNSNINKSLRRWHCESVEELHELVMLAEQFIRNHKK